MEEMGKDIDRILNAGIHAVSRGLNKSADLLEKLAREDAACSDQAGDAVRDAAEKMKKTVSDILGVRIPADRIKESLKTLSREELAEIAALAARLMEEMDGKENPGAAGEDASMPVDSPDEGNQGCGEGERKTSPESAPSAAAPDQPPVNGEGDHPAE